MRRNVAFTVVLIALVFAAFGPALGAEFVAWDDDQNFLHNQAYRGLALHNLGWMFTTFHMGPYQPLSWVTLAVDHAVYGMDARGYHVTNVMIHAAAVVAFFFLARRLFELARPSWNAATRDSCAFVAALLFGIHPLRVESVAWITERRDVLSGLFFVATMLAWLGYAASAGGGKRRYWMALVAFVLALLSKASVVTLPIALLILDVWPLRRVHMGVRRLLLEKVPFLALSVLFAVLAVVGQSSTGTAMRTLADHGLVRRLEQSSYAALFYPWKTIAPSGLSPIYDMPSPFDPLSARFLVAVALFVAVCAGTWLLRRRAPALTVAWITALVLLAPVSGLVSTGPHLVADRYSYLACMPFAVLAAGCVGLALERGFDRMAVTTLTAAACVALVLCTWRQTGYWRTSIDLWERAFAVDPDSATACDHLGVMRADQSTAANLTPEERMHRLDEAITLYARAIDLAPHPNHYFNIGGALLDYSSVDRPENRTEHLELAADTMQKGLEFASETTGIQPRWRGMYAAVLVELGRRDAAREQLTLALREEPNSVGCLQWSARIALEEQRPEEAIELLRRTTVLEPENPMVWSILANTYSKLGRSEEARVALETSMRLKGAHAAVDAGTPSIPSTANAPNAH